MKVLITVLTSTLLTFGISQAQQPDFTPEGTVNGQGQLVLPGMDPISPPSTQTPSTTPDATILPDGSLDLDNGAPPIEAPRIPVSVFFSEKSENLFDNWYFHPLISSYADVGNNWIYVADWKDSDNAFFFVATDPGRPDNGFWLYSLHFESWVFFGTSSGMFSDISDPKDTQIGWFYVNSPAPGEPNWHYQFQRLIDGEKRSLYIKQGGAPSDWVVTRELP